MNPNDERLEDIALLALGVLPESEAQAVAEFAPAPGCITEFGELRAAADLVGYAAETADLVPNELQSARMKSRIMGSVRGTTRPAGESTTDAVTPLRRPMPWLAYIAAAASLAVAFLATFNLRAERDKNAAADQQIALLRAELDQSQQTNRRTQASLAFDQSVMADLLAAGAERFPVSGGLIARSGPHIVLALQKLPQLPRGKVYQAWTLHRGAKAVTPDITFVPDSTGLALVELRPSAASDVAAVAVSVEPTGGSKAPTTKPTLVRPLT